MRNLLLCALLVGAALTGPFLWDRWQRQRQVAAEQPGSDASGSPRSATPASPTPPEVVEDVEPPGAGNPLIEGLRQMLDSSAGFEDAEEEWEQLHEQLNEADQLLTRIKSENREALERIRQNPLRRRTGSPAPRARPNIILIDIGALAPSDLSCYNPDAEHTRLFDLLAEQGVRCTSFYRNSTTTRVERLTLLSGDAGRAATPGWDLHKATLLTTLVDAGYETNWIGDCSLGGLDPHELGFDSWFGAKTEEEASQRELDQVWANGAQLELIVDDVSTAFDTQTIYFAEAISFAKRQRRGQPFFLWLTLPYPMAKEPSGDARRDQLRQTEKELTDFITQLNETKLANNAVVLLTSLASRPSLTESEPPGGRWQSPLIFVGPGRIPRGGTCDAVLTTADLWATLAELAAVSPPDNGSVSIAASLLGKRPDAKGRAFVAWRDGPSEYVRFDHWFAASHPDLPVQLFDVRDAEAGNADLAGLHPQAIVFAKRFLAEAKAGNSWIGEPENPLQ